MSRSKARMSPNSSLFEPKIQNRLAQSILYEYLPNSNLLSIFQRILLPNTYKSAISPIPMIMCISPRFARLHSNFDLIPAADRVSHFYFRLIIRFVLLEPLQWLY